MPVLISLANVIRKVLSVKILRVDKKIEEGYNKGCYFEGEERKVKGVAE